ncbi:MAG: flavin monoamine oxidase family protein [Hydrogenophaga sp.]|uniref:flavin monoamine oxidase family protein n=1 Tax=Hydrogenophaga sp. TaxID=1904254 RepID=UPI003D9BCEA4
MNTRVIIVGGGLSGLYAAHRLTQQGVEDWVLLEARRQTGGRIVSVPANNARALDAHQPPAADRFDLGPSWFWPGYQRQLDRLVTALGLQTFEQHDSGDLLVERAPHQPAVRARGYANEPPSMRLAGGMAALTDALRSGLDPARVQTGQVVRSLRRDGAHVAVDSEGAQGQATTWRADHVLLALPPRLATDAIRFQPELPAALARQWQQTPTWMAPHAKYLAVYERPFWREQGLSGAARSAWGPMVEIHDASMPGGHAALFGFLGVPAPARARLGDAELRSLCRAQFARLFGPDAALPVMDVVQDWAQEVFTSTDADVRGGGEHPSAPAAVAADGPWHGHLTGIGSEWSPQFPGYVAGAIEAAEAGVQAWMQGAAQRPG